MVTRLLIDESLNEDGSARQMHLLVVPVDEPGGDPRVRVVDDDATLGVISVAALCTIMRRYGRPLDRAAGAPGEVMPLGQGRTLGRLRFRAAVDAAGRDYAVLSEPGREPLATLGRQLASALRFVLMRARS